MRIETYKNYNPDVKRRVKPKEIIIQVLRKIGNTLRYLEKIKPEVMAEYMSAFERRLSEEVKGFSFDSSVFDFSETRKEWVLLNDYLDAQELIVQLVCKYLPLPADYHPKEEEIELFVLDEMRATFLTPYHRVKAFADVLGKEEGIQLWKDILVRATDDAMDSIEERPPLKEFAEQSIKGFAESEGSDFTAVVLDDYRFLLKFDRCIVHEALKYLDDPEFVYLSYCWTGDVEDARTTKIRRRRRSQTLHLGEFCDEFFWDNDVYKDAEQPALEFMRGLGKE